MGRGLRRCRGGTAHLALVHQGVGIVIWAQAGVPAMNFVRSWDSRRKTTDRQEVLILVGESWDYEHGSIHDAKDAVGVAMTENRPGMEEGVPTRWTQGG